MLNALPTDCPIIVKNLYQLAQLMREGIVVPVPTNYKMSREANDVLVAIQKLEFSQQITVLRNAVADMGINFLG
jgi:hypothetical protein